MLIPDLQSVFRARGVNYPFAFLRKAGISYHSATALLNRNNRAIRYDHLTIICRVLNCTPNDLFVYIPSANDSLPPDHQLNTLKKDNTLPDFAETIRQIPLSQLQQIANIIKNPKKPDL
jgi:DNA-binding Xre family transcriptional regulator